MFYIFFQLLQTHKLILIYTGSNTKTITSQFFVSFVTQSSSCKCQTVAIDAATIVRATAIFFLIFLLFLCIIRKINKE